jgi:hypothetical protein
MFADGPESQKYPESSARQPSGDAQRRRDDRASRERGIAEIAAHQHGLVTLEQLRSVCLSTNAYLERLRLGRLFRIHKGVYAVAIPK